jgi:biotin synthase
MSAECDIKLCASHGLLTKEQFKRLRESGVTTYHCNIETSRRYFPYICTTHTFDDKIACIKRAKECGLNVCSGGIIGMGETWEDRADMALTLAELEIRSVPINALRPIKGTALGDEKPMTEEDILRTAAIFRFILPEAYIRLAAGRIIMERSGERAFRSGANAAITGDMLTTSGNDIRTDIEMLKKLGFDV